MNEAAAIPTTRWIVGRRYDLLWFFGGMGVSLAFVGLSLGAGVSIVVLWWTWILFFDGPHIAAAFTRTYVDREEWRKRRGVLIISLLLFAVGPACLGLNLLTGSDLPSQSGSASSSALDHCNPPGFGGSPVVSGKNTIGACRPFAP